MSENHLQLPLSAYNLFHQVFDTIQIHLKPVQIIINFFIKQNKYILAYIIYTIICSEVCIG